MPRLGVVRRHVDRGVDDLRGEIEIVFLGEALGAGHQQVDCVAAGRRHRFSIASMIGAATSASFALPSCS